MSNLHLSAETRHVQGGEIKFAYRSFGYRSQVPVIFLQHFTGTMDNWDPLVTNGIALHQQVILFNNAGVGSSSGITPDSVDTMAEDALAFIDSLMLQKIDLLGFSLGGFIAQVIAVKRPDLVRRIVLVGTGPRGSEGLGNLPVTVALASQKEPVERMLFMFFSESENSLRSGRNFLARIFQRVVNRDPEMTEQSIASQQKAIVDWGIARHAGYPDLKNIVHPVLIVNGGYDRIVPIKNSYILFEQLSNAFLHLYPDAAHGALFQYPELFVNQVVNFLKQ
ncbi:alpha/beta fold hydrolase [Dyadobacter psychrotolerans]|uniref:Alpha/beta hydrolase n=1 Tax=Dyadobacter psychrotolerans TaxID=2541721 RepID=A0A4R5DFW5_9BACT|nr:alpha/beta hydrolase [Dyadobacter psychrotolerans]TDE10791.1 alpha/beta hydrolase [Dyadobacter psychrotolerans]